MRISRSVYLVASGDMGIGLTNGADCNVYLLDCGSTKVLIDSGVGIDSYRIIKEIENDGISCEDIGCVLLTHHHADHAGGAAFFKREYGCSIAAPAEEAASIEEGDEAVLGLEIARKAGFYPVDYTFCACKIDKRIKANEKFTIGSVTFTAFEASGHSLGGLCYYAALDGRRSLFAGDLVSHGGLISLQNIPGADVHNYSRSVLALEGLEVDSFYPGHGCMSLSNGYAHLDKAIKAFRNLGIPHNAV
jgi:glyoxylase-like metal-dependent hydrolase (beta-lactamase superfamily II)